MNAVCFLQFIVHVSFISRFLLRCRHCRWPSQLSSYVPGCPVTRTRCVHHADHSFIWFPLEFSAQHCAAADVPDEVVDFFRGPSWRWQQSRQRIPSCRAKCERTRPFRVNLFHLLNEFFVAIISSISFCRLSCRLPKPSSISEDSHEHPPQTVAD